MPTFDRSYTVDRLRAFQRRVRDAIVRSNAAGNLSEVSRSSSADTIYKIDAEVDPILEQFCEEWGREVPLVLVAEGMQNERGEEGPLTFPRGIPESKAVIRVIVDPIDGTRGIMYDKRAAWALAGVAPNKGPGTRLRDIEVAVMTELPTSKMGFGDVLWAIRGNGAHGSRERLAEKSTAIESPGSPSSRAHRPIGRVLTKLGKVSDENVVEALNAQKRHGGLVGQILVGMGYVQEQDIQIALAFQQGSQPDMAPEVMSYITGDRLPLRPSQADNIDHGFAMVSNFFPRHQTARERLDGTHCREPDRPRRRHPGDRL